MEWQVTIYKKKKSDMQMEDLVNLITPLTFQEH